MIINEFAFMKIDETNRSLYEIGLTATEGQITNYTKASGVIRQNSPIEIKTTYYNKILISI